MGAAYIIAIATVLIQVTRLTNMQDSRKMDRQPNVLELLFTYTVETHYNGPYYNGSRLSRTVKKIVII
jgi:hypothetical protein